MPVPNRRSMQTALNTPANKMQQLRLAPGLVAQLRNYIELTRLNRP